MRYLAAVFVVAATLARGADIPVAGDRFHRALQQLSAEEFSDRESAMQTLHVEMGQQVAEMLRATDPETESRLAELLAYQDALSRWAADVIKLPRDARKAEVDFGLRPDVLNVIGQLYSNNPADRCEGVRVLARYPDSIATNLLARAVNDTERSVSLAAMEVAWDRKEHLNDALIDALWSRAVEAGFVANQPRNMMSRPLTFRNVQVGVESTVDNTLYRRAQDSTIATDVLVHLDPPQLRARTVDMLDQIDKAYAAQQGNGQAPANAWMYMPTQEPMKNLARLVETLQPKEGIAPLIRIASGSVCQKSEGMVNGARYFFSNRTWALALATQLTGRSPEDAKLVRIQPLNNLWAAPSQAEEDAAIADLKTWWERNHEKYEGK